VEEIILLEVSAKKVAGALFLALVLLTLASFAARFIEYMWGMEGALRLLAWFDVGEEDSLPTWYASFTLLLSSILLAFIAIAKKRHDDRHALHWRILSIIFLVLSIDEIAQLHEKGLGELAVLIENSTGFISEVGIDAYGWVVPAAALVVVVVLAFLGFFAHLPRRTLLLFIVAGTLFVVGALGMETLTGQLIDNYGGYDNWDNVEGIPKMIAGIEGSIEEFLETLGVVVFIYALLSYASSYVKEITVQVHEDNE
jgi:hypothetical protein